MGNEEMKLVASKHAEVHPPGRSALSHPTGDPNMPEEIQLAKTIWSKVGKKADVGGTTEKFSLESGKCVEDEDNATKCVKDDATKTVEDNPTKKRKIEDDTLAHLSSSDEEEDQQTDKATAPDKTEKIETMKTRIPPMTPKVTNEVDMPTVAT